MDSGSEEESVLDVGEEQLCGEGLEVDEFAETLKLIESTAEEIEEQLLDAISEVGGNITQMFNTILHFATWLYHSLSLFLFVSCTIGRRSEIFSMSRLPKSLQVKGGFNQASSKQTS